jgi:type IV pilus assembly protein PilA
MKKVQQGFTLIELMIVVAIIGILAAIAIPAYQDYITKSQLQRAVGELSGLKTAIEEGLSRNWVIGTDSTPPTTCADVGFTGSSLMSTPPAADQGCTLTVDANNTVTIEATLAGAVSGTNMNGTVTLERDPTTSVWSCTIAGGNTIAEKHLPAGCSL